MQTLKTVAKNEKAEIQLEAARSPGTSVNVGAVTGLLLMESVRAATAHCSD